MQRFIGLAGGLSSPATLIVVVWGIALALVAVGPIDYPGQPSLAVLAVVGIGIVLFLLGYRGGGSMFDRWFGRGKPIAEPSARTLNRAVTITSLIGIAGIGFVALDRMVLSGVSNGVYAELLRCAPGLVNAIAIKRTPILYLGYVMFSFGFVSVILFLLKGEVVRGWAAALAQLSIVSPVGYALLYSGRMPILLVILLVIAAILVRVSEGRRPLPAGHYLLLKAVLAVGLFAVYSSSIWSSRQNFCAQLTPLIHELEQKQQLQQRQQQQQQQQQQQPAPAAAETRKSNEVISGTDLSKQMAAATTGPSAAPAPQPLSADAVLAIMLEAWHVKPRGYVTAAVNAGYLSPRAMMIGLSTYFYLTHGVRSIDVGWQARDGLSPQWGVYEVGVLSPILRVFFRSDQQVNKVEAEQRSAGLFGFFPSAWLAAFIDFGLVGAIIYILVWGCMAGWSAAGTKLSHLLTPRLLLVFTLASILLSPVQGPLGVANSALVLVSMLAAGLAVDIWTRSAGERTKA
ncbi:hypothetical protein IC762_24910 [Bradyrhizobium genosp. L]|uniref:hypothetical protein n=1 Tax=Bradyrhizobium genosp. L TaxID=83637 RepID=UPI0018A32CDE|nr:hypothetical protein [Bradyrhizobium genosp. L]QPF82965.1 hypothetical protein IC762_24910 [Bradyrhizobium genosp. L]